MQVFNEKSNDSVNLYQSCVLKMANIKLLDPFFSFIT